MKPAIFVKHPNQNRFIGTFDMTNLEIWWLSEPLPGDVVEVVDVDWAYAQYHVCVCRMNDGTYSIIRSPDYGQSWVEVKNLAETIYSVTRIDYGWLMAATSTGWYESMNSGLTWTKVSASAPGCRAVAVIGDNVLIAHDGRYVWRSVDYARHWSQVLDCRNIYYKQPHGGFRTQTYSGDVIPAVAGFGNQVFAAAGPYLLMSDDEGQSWTMPWGWPSMYGGSSGNPSINPYFGSSRLIQIVHTGAYNDPENPGITYQQFVHTWMFRVYIPTLGIVRCLVSNGGDFEFIAKFDQPFTGYYSGGITAFEVLRPGSEDYDTLVFCPDPKPRSSLDRGWSWSDLDPSEFSVYLGDPDQEINASVIPFTEEFAEYLWSGHPCHNSGTYIREGGPIRRGLSYDLDFKTETEFEETVDIDVLLMVVNESGVDHDLIARKTFESGYQVDEIQKKALSRPYVGNMPLQDTFDFGANHDFVLVHRYTWPWEMDILEQKALTLGWYNDILQQTTLVEGHEMAMYLVDDQTDEIEVDIDRKLPQVWRVQPPRMPFKVLDSRKDDFDELGE